jgi:transposase
MLDVAGIDVSARKLDVARFSNTGALHQRQFEQSPTGHHELAVYLERHQVEAVVMEATGIYYLDAAVALHNAGIPVSVINPRAAHHFAKVMLQDSKTDRIDARLLAEYARRMTFKPWQPPREDWLALRDIARRINQLNGMCTAEKNRLHALQARQHTRKTMIDELQAHIQQLEHSIERLTAAAVDVIGQDPALTQYDACLTSATGIARASAVALLGELCLLPKELRADQVSRQAGLDVRLTESGSSIDQPGRLSKGGNTYLRAGLHMPSLSLVRHDPRAKAHYEALIARGKKKMQALCAVQRKMLTGLWACMHANEPFDSAKLFAIEPENA